LTAGPADGFVAAAPLADLPEGGLRCVAIAGERVLLARVAGRVFALSERCGHKNAPLSRGRLLGHIVECPLHFAQFDVRSGRLVDGPVSADLAVYQVRLADGTVFVKP
jgi:3-phenylpropionate/trans-cinnamate dioxygenase ferredoxin component